MNIKAKAIKIYNLYEHIFNCANSLQYVGWVGHKNLGDEAIKDACSELYEPFRMVPSGKCNYRLVESIKKMRRLKGVILGGGTLIGHNGPILEVKYGLEKYGCGIIIGAGVEPLTGDLIPDWLLQWRDVLVNIKYVGVRGLDSANTLSKVGINAVVTGDTALYFGEDYAYWSPLPMHIGVNIGHSFGHVYGSEESIFDSYSEFIRLLIIDGWNVEFFCVVPDDEKITFDTAKKAGIERPIVHKIYTDSKKYKELVRKMSAFIGMKLHAVVLANCAGVPAIMIEYRPKCYEYMRSIDMEDFVIRSDNICPVDVMQKIDYLNLNKLDISNSITRRVREYKNKLIDFANESRIHTIK